jgi:hypothetical protein
MSAPIVDFGATVLCSHGGQASPTQAFPRAMLSGQPVVTLSATYTVVGCTLRGTLDAPYETGTWGDGARRVQAGGVPVALGSGTSVCSPTGTPLLLLAVQSRVFAR